MQLLLPAVDGNRSTIYVGHFYSIRLVIGEIANKVVPKII